MTDIELDPVHEAVRNAWRVRIAQLIAGMTVEKPEEDE